ncbi:hypothetical protein THICB1_230001 [Thiomonas arsenitoxydans]|uniref:Uncharacterized protein n=1 Tax=Thiomonas arsenitoxydans (strain DSM 22701 / CIP 110005 / 3As) TaxID=426114 RepID=A0ABP1Z649_THIA3|nr:hypothetical protein THICB1_230001 [Thiomonas arsenitoxydans]CQR36926.1 hypothetical protein THICB6_300001 [Thiomonas arsenitoxydans]CQR37058.1 hypothetical protein ACO3_500001 [Thiomonas arsenitoxydans]CQR37204.1 hypothetical protein ACO7_500001 [Thiomonas arsenitoxydans]
MRHLGFNWGLKGYLGRHTAGALCRFP